MQRRAWPGVAAWTLFGLAVVGVATIPWFDHLLRRAGRPDLTQLNPSTVPLVLAALVAASVGAVLASRRPRHPVGWLLLGLGLTVTASGVFDGYVELNLSPWDVAAGALLVEEAGGVVTDWSGGGNYLGGEVLARLDGALLGALASRQELALRSLGEQIWVTLQEALA